MAYPSSTPSSFQGFDAPHQNWFRMPNEWIDLCAEINSLAELKVVQYVMRHTWGHQEYGIKKRISLDEFMYGRQRKDGVRMDRGTGLSKPSVIAGIRSAVERGFLIEEVDSSDKARIKKFYSLRMHAHAQREDERAPSEEPEQERSPQESGGGVNGVKDLNADVKNLYPDVKIVYPSSKESIHRTKKDTLERHLQKDNNTVSAVVAELSSRGISLHVAKSLAHKHTQAYIEKKIEFYDYLLAERPSDIKKPAAWLRSAIESDYNAPDGFVSGSERQRQAEEAKRRKQAVLAAQEAREKDIERARQSGQKQLESRLSLLREEYVFKPEAEVFWKAFRQAAHVQTPPSIYTLIADAHILQVANGEMVVAVTANIKLKQLTRPATQAALHRIAKQVLQEPVTLRFVSFAKAMGALDTS